MSSNARLRRRRATLFAQQGGKCHWCQGDMVLFDDVRGACGDSRQDNAATIDHLRDRFDPSRREPAACGEQRLVAACRKCNHDRGAQRQAAQPIEELRRRSKSMTAEEKWGGAITFDPSPATFKLGELLAPLVPSLSNSPAMRAQGET